MTNQPFTIHFVIAGGTIDSYYDGSKDTAVPNKESVIPAFVKSLKLYHKTEFTTVCMKDSREMTTEDLENIRETIEKSPHKKNYYYAWNLYHARYSTFFKSEFKKK